MRAHVLNLTVIEEELHKTLRARGDGKTRASIAIYIVQIG